MAHRKPIPLHRPTTEAELERPLLEMIELQLAGDGEAAAERAQVFLRNRLMAATTLAGLIIRGRVQDPELGLQVIESVMQGRSHEIMREIALNPHAGDVARLGAHRRIGWAIATSEAEDAQLRLEFLSTLQDTQGAVVELLQTLGDAWPIGLNVIGDVVCYLGVLPSEERLNMLQASLEGMDNRGDALLHAMLPIDDPPTQLFALRELARRRNPASAGPIARAARFAADDAVRREADATAQRLRLRPVDRADAQAEWQLPTEMLVRSTGIDRNGRQIIVLVWKQHGNLTNVARFLLRDDGIGDIDGGTVILPEDMNGGDDEDDLLDLDEPDYEFDDEMMGDDAIWTMSGALQYQREIDLVLARGMIAWGLERNASLGRSLTPTFELWEPFLHQALPPTADEPAGRAMLSDSRAPTTKLRLRECQDLLEHPAFADWLFDLAVLAPAMVGIPPPQSANWSQQQYQPLVERLFSERDPERMRRALLRQAVLLDTAADRAVRDLALRAAATLRGATVSDLSRNSFVQGLLQGSVSVGFGPTPLFNGLLS